MLIIKYELIKNVYNFFSAVFLVEKSIMVDTLFLKDVANIHLIFKLHNFFQQKTPIR